MKLSRVNNLKFLVILILLLPAIKLKAKWNSSFDNKGNVKTILERGDKKQPIIKNKQKLIIINPYIKQNSTINNFSIANTSNQAFIIDKSEEIYFETISNPTKATNYVIGICSNIYSVEATLNPKETGFEIQIGIINYATSDFSWKDYLSAIQHSIGEFYSNYTTSSSKGKYHGNYLKIADNKFHQFLGFHKQLDYIKIKKMFVIINSTIFDLQFISY